LNFPISSFQYGNDHFSGDSTTPSYDMNRVAANRDIGSPSSGDLRAKDLIFLAFCQMHGLEKGE
jgi:hypothetical protein